MRQKQNYEDILVFESFKYRAQRLRGFLRICDWCLLRRRRCNDSHRPYTDKTWKSYRSKQWRT
jgi:hypothetical protein